jgi:hypothetical protein
VEIDLAGNDLCAALGKQPYYGAAQNGFAAAAFADKPYDPAARNIKADVVQHDAAAAVFIERDREAAYFEKFFFAGAAGGSFSRGTSRPFQYGSIHF